MVYLLSMLSNTMGLLNAYFGLADEHCKVCNFFQINAQVN